MGVKYAQTFFYTQGGNVNTENYPVNTVQKIVHIIRQHGYTSTGEKKIPLITDEQIAQEKPEIIKILSPRFKEYFGGLFGRFWFAKVAIIEVQRDSDNPQWFVKSFFHDRKALDLLLDLQDDCNIQLSFV